MVTREDRNQTFGPTGALLAEQVVQTDITAEAVYANIEARARTALANNQAFLGIQSPSNAQVVAQVRALTRQVNAIIRRVIAGDLLVESTDI